jgi:hypothetical protein
MKARWPGSICSSDGFAPPQSSRHCSRRNTHGRFVDASGARLEGAQRSRTADAKARGVELGTTTQTGVRHRDLAVRALRRAARGDCEYRVAGVDRAVSRAPAGAGRCWWPLWGRGHFRPMSNSPHSAPVLRSSNRLTFCAGFVRTAARCGDHSWALSSGNAYSPRSTYSRSHAYRARKMPTRTSPPEDLI